MKNLFIYLLFISNIIFSQDIHFSQIYNDILYENPSYTGKHEGVSQVCLINKDQWRSVSIPYKTFYFDFDKKIPKISGAFGLNLFQDNTGDLNLTSNQCNLTYSHLFKFNKSNLFIGLYTGVGQLKIDYSNLILIDNENFNITSVSYFDMGLGFSYLHYLNDKIYLENNFSISHLNNPSVSLSENHKNNNLSLKYIYNFKLNYFLLYDNIISSLKILNQGSFNKIELGSLYSFNNFSGYSIYPGLWYRHKDAIILSCGFKSRKYAFDLSYDFNISSLSNASNYKGGFEITIRYLFINKIFIEPKEYICPDYL